MKVLVESHHDLPTAEVLVVVPSGAAADPPGLEGRARHAAELMRRGAAGRSRRDLDLALDALGASLDVEAGQDSVTFRAHGLSRHLEAIVDLLAEVVCLPDFPEEEHEKLRRESLALLDEIRDDDATLCARFFERHALSGHPYGRSVLGTSGSLARIGREDARAWARRHLVKSHLIVGFAGNVDEARANRLAERAFGSLPDGPAPDRPDLEEPRVAGGRRTILVDKPGRAQSQILLGHGGPRPSRPDWLALHVGAVVFGGTFTSRLVTEVRQKRGWSYGAGCRVGRARAGHTIRIRVFPALTQTPDTLALVLAMWEDLSRNGVTADEVEFAKSYLEGSWAFEIDTALERLEHRIDTLVLDLPPDTYPRWLERLCAVSVADVNTALRQWMRPQDATIVITTTASVLRPRLEGLPLGRIDVEPYDGY